MTPPLPKLGIVAGAGALPLEIVRACANRPYHMIAIDEFAGPMPASTAHTRFAISKIGAIIAELRRQGCADITFAGKFERPNGKNIKLRPDLGGLEFMARILGQFGRNDDTLHRAIANMFTSRGFRVVSPLDAAPALAAREGCLTKTLPGPALKGEFSRALKLAKEHGATRRGQAVVVENGAVIASESRAGTDAMLQTLGDGKRSDAILVKAMTPTQLPTIDPPAIGESTVINAARAGLAGILVEAGRSVIVDEAAVRARSDELGLFVCAASMSSP
ncbi:MAG: LpxI family protein [Micropepsaceae bacterium]